MKRIWKNHQGDDGSLFPIGNGDLLAYFRGPHMERCFGVPYSMTDWGKMLVEIPGCPTWKSESERHTRTPFLTHTLFDNQTRVAQIFDFIDANKNVLTRQIQSDTPLTFTVHPDEQCRLIELGNYFERQGLSGNCVLLNLAQSAIFNYVWSMPDEKNLILAAKNADIRIQNNQVLIEAPAGVTELYLFAGNTMQDLVDDAESFLACGTETRLAGSKAHWQNIAREREGCVIHESHPEADRIRAAIDSVGSLILAQQSRSGGVMAGHIYNMAYVRDMSGVMRGLLALGHIQQARAILDFWWNVFGRNGDLWNAEGMGNPSARLQFPNDEVEIPGYILMDMFAYADQTGDDTILKDRLPMLTWAMDVQLKHLAGGMLGFSGDETYIAANVFPAYLIDHGSAESTMLFIEGGTKLLALMDKHQLGAATQRERYRCAVAKAQSLYRHNFIHDGVLYANNPARVDLAQHPRFAFGFCQAKMQLDNDLDLRWLERNAEGYYVCPEMRSRKMPPRDHKRYVMNSISMAMAYHHTSLFNTNELIEFGEPGINVFAQTGAVASEVGGHRSLGYDYGMMLYALAEARHPLASKAMTKVLDVIDPTGAWVEFYDHDVPTGCRSRPWESGINIEAILHACRP